MSQGVVRANVYDWHCDDCDERRYFTGRFCGIFPARRESCYTTEMMYVLLEMTCMQGMTFRNAYKAIRLFARLPSTLERLRSLSPELLAEEERRSRRRASEAFSFFLKHIDTSSPLLTSKLFSCATCEQPLTSQECQELGFSEDEGKHLKRLRAVVIDGTAAGILTKLPSFDKRSLSLPVAKNGLGAVHLLQNPNHRKVLGKLLDLLRQCLRSWKKNAKTSQRNREIFETGYLNFWLENRGQSPRPNILVPKVYMKPCETEIIQLYINEEHCFCPSQSGDSDPSEPHDDVCEDIRASFEAVKGVQEIGGVLREIITVTESEFADVEPSPQSNGNGQGQQEHEEASDNEQDDTDAEWDDMRSGSEDSEEEHPVNTGNTSQTHNPPVTESSTTLAIWGSLRMLNVEQSAKFAEAAIDLFHFLTIEHIALSYVGRVTASPEFQSTANPTSMLSFTAVHFHLHDGFLQAADQYCGCIHFQEAGRTHIVSPTCLCAERLKSATIALNDANPILTTFGQELLKLRRPLQMSETCIVKSLMDLLLKHMEVGKNYFVKLERNLSHDSKLYWEDHGKFVTSSLSEQNEMQGRTTIASLEARQAPAADSANEQNEGTEHIDGAEVGSNTQQNVLPNGEAPHAEMDLQEITNRLAELEMEDSIATGICFPGRISSRPPITFTTKDKQNCTKKYNVSRSHTPGLLTVQCACDSPKLIGVVVMTQAESTSLALSAILTNLGIPPKMVYYDNACNLFISTLLRVPWLLGKTRFAVDRFHYKSHKCCAYFNPDSYPKLDTQRTETAESINARIEESLASLRYMKGEKLIPYLRSRFSLMNLNATFKQKYLRTDLEDEDMTAFFNEIYSCECDSCKQLKQINERKKNIEDGDQSLDDALTQHNPQTQENGQTQQDGQTQHEIPEQETTLT